MAKEEVRSFKILLLGDTQVGKTSFIMRFCDDVFNGEQTLSTLGVDEKIKFIKREEQKMELHIWDTAGQERFRSITKNYYKGADGVILMYDMSKINTFKGIKKWIGNIKESFDISTIALIVVGNKCDLPEDEIAVSKEDVSDFEKKEGLKIFQGSAKNNINVNESFSALLDKMVELGLGKIKNRNEQKDNNGPQKLKLPTNNKKDNKNGNCCGKK